MKTRLFLHRTIARRYRVSDPLLIRMKCGAPYDRRPLVDAAKYGRDGHAGAGRDQPLLFR